MIDQDEYDAYEEWKARKLAGATDISVAAFNTEQESTALAWEAGVKALAKQFPDIVTKQHLTEALELNPYRAYGTMGFRKHEHQPTGSGIGDGPGGQSIQADQSRRVISPPQGILRTTFAPSAGKDDGEEFYQPSLGPDNV